MAVITSYSIHYTKLYELPETTAHVQAVLKELGYVYNQPLAKRKTSNSKQALFAIILPNLVNPYFAELLDVVEQEAQFLGRALLVFNSRGDTQRELTLLQECQKYKLDGLFIVPCSRSNEHLEALNHVPFPRITSYNVCYTKLLRGPPF